MPLAKMSILRQVPYFIEAYILYIVCIEAYKKYTFSHFNITEIGLSYDHRCVIVEQRFVLS